MRESNKVRSSTIVKVFYRKKGEETWKEIIMCDERKEV